ncbi:hypothetical protein AHAS_Ahas14G0199500 [Arachis hypogaea]
MSSCQESDDVNMKDQTPQTDGDMANEGSLPPEKEFGPTHLMTESPGGTTLTEPSQVSQVTCISSSSVNALTTAVDLLASKVEACERRQLERDSAIDVMCSILFSIQASVTNKIAIEKEYSYVTENLCATTTPKRKADSKSYNNVEDFNRTIREPISILDDDESAAKPPKRPTSSHNRNQKSAGQQGSFKTATEVVAHKETKLISTQGKHFTHSVGASQNTRGSLYGCPTMIPKNNYGRTSANLLRTGSIGGTTKFPGLGPGDPIQGFPVNPPLKAVAAYAFNPMGDPMEELVRFGHCVLQRHNILTLQPPHMPDDNIFEMFALRVSLATRGNDGVEFWTLPPGFAIDFREGRSVEELASRYKERWMRPSNSLNYIYIPVKDACGHWYLAVVAFRERTLYHLDASMDEEGSVSRKLFVRNLGEALSRLVAIGEYSSPLAKKAAEITCFSIASADGLPMGQPKGSMCNLGTQLDGYGWCFPT